VLYYFKLQNLHFDYLKYIILFILDALIRKTLRIASYLKLISVII